MLVKGVFHKNEKLNVEDNEFKEKLREISTSWINKYNYYTTRKTKKTILQNNNKMNFLMIL